MCRMHKEGFLEEIESMRSLTEKEKEICANMVKASKLSVVDTIKGFRPVDKKQ